MKKIFQTLMQKWPEYLLEVIVIVIGLLIAVQINNWNSDRKQELSALANITILKNNLLEDREELNVIYQKVDSTLQFNDLLLKQIQTVIPINDYTPYYLEALVIEYNFTSNTYGFEILNNTGDLSYLDSELQVAIMKYYSLMEQAKGRELISNTYIKNEYEPLFLGNYVQTLQNSHNKHSVVREFYRFDPRPTIELNHITFLADRKLEGMIMARRYQSAIQKEAYEKALAQLKMLLKYIEKLEVN